MSDFQELKAKATEAERNRNNKQWYKDFIEKFNGYSHSQGGLFYAFNDAGFTDYHRMRVNFDLYNNILHKEDFLYVIKPFGDSRDLGEMPADFTNKDIISSKIKSLLSMERDRPFDWHVTAVNPEAISAKDDQRRQALLDFVQQSIVAPLEQAIQMEIEQRIQELEHQFQQQAQQQQQEQDEAVSNAIANTPPYDEVIDNYNQEEESQEDEGNPFDMEQMQQQEQEQEQPDDTDGQEEPEQQEAQQQDVQQQPDEQQQQPSQEDILQQQRQHVDQQKQQIIEEAQAKLEKMKPKDLERYNQRRFTDPTEVLCTQLLNYTIKKQDVLEKFNLGFKNGLISGRTIFWTGILNQEPTLNVVNPLGFSYDRSNYLKRIEDGEWASYEQFMTPTDIVKMFGDELEEEDIDKIYEEYNSQPTQMFNYNPQYSNWNQGNGVRVFHCEWKGLKKINFLSGVDPETLEPYYLMVDEDYKLNPDVGDQVIESMWIPTKFEGYKIGRDVYVYLREVPGQHKDINNIYDCKLSYIGNSYDSTNSVTTSLVDRMKHFQYLYNIIWYRIELLTAKDDVKKLLIGSNAISSSSELDVHKWLHYLKTMNIGIVNLNEEGNKGMPTNINSFVSQIDMSMSNDIQRYIQLAQYIEQMCGETIGITKQDIQASEQLTLQTGKAQNNSVIDSYFQTHRDIKRRVLQQMIEVMKVAYSYYKPDSLAYFLDDVSLAQLNPDYDKFDNTTYGLFIDDNPAIDDRVKQIETLAQASLQAQKIDLSDVLSIMSVNNIEEAKEMLLASEQRKRDEAQQIQQQAQQQQMQMLQMQQQMQKEQNDFKMQFMIKQEQLKKERELQKQLILSAGFNEDKDMDKDGIPDIIEIYKTGKNVDIKEKGLVLKKEALELKKKELDQKAEQHKVDADIKRMVLRKHVK